MNNGDELVDEDKKRMTKTNKLFLVGGLAAVIFASVLISASMSREDEVEEITVATSAAIKECSAVLATVRESRRTVSADGPAIDFSTSEHTIMTDCLVARDPVYAAAHQKDLCKRAKDTGIKPEKFTQPALRRCFGLE